VRDLHLNTKMRESPQGNRAAALAPRLGNMARVGVALNAGHTIDFNIALL